MKHNESPPDLQSQAITELRSDLTEKSILLSSLLKSLPRNDPAIEPIRMIIATLISSKKSNDLHALRLLKREALILYRTMLIDTAARAVAPNWQSPSALHAVHDEAGHESGKIRLTMNDYKRDYHADAIPYEQAFRREYIDGLVTLGVHVYLVSSGMAGLTTILAYLQGEKYLNGTIVVGANTYFQSKGLILNAAGARAIQVPETDTHAILKLITKKKPTVIFLDSLTNSAGMSAPDLTTILKHLVKTTRHDMALIVDNTGLSIGFQPMNMILGRNPHLRVVVYESINKFHEFGVDRVTAGVIWAYGPGTEKLFDYRKNCGTNIPDLSAHCLPTPNRKLLEGRLNRINRNTSYLAGRLETFIQSGSAPAFSGVVYPGSPSHPSYSWVKEYPFHGCLIALHFTNPKATINASQSFIRRAMSEAKRQNLPLVGGTSFGFDTTRIYITASNTDYGQPFLRIATGTEDMDTLDRLASILEYAMKHA